MEDVLVKTPETLMAEHRALGWEEACNQTARFVPAMPPYRRLRYAILALSSVLYYEGSDTNETYRRNHVEYAGVAVRYAIQELLDAGVKDIGQLADQNAGGRDALLWISIQQMTRVELTPDKDADSLSAALMVLKLTDACLRTWWRGSWSGQQPGDAGAGDRVRVPDDHSAELGGAAQGQPDNAGGHPEPDPDGGANGSRSPDDARGAVLGQDLPG